ncbi:unnamed protein product [Amoebophrya sp. A120]|nr:unnamed protein product [Amoebophrya sp. A120]|eukprot:GSA120T00012453001.1
MPTVYANLYPAFTSTPLPLRSCIVKRIMLQRKERLPLHFRGNTSSWGGSLPPPARIFFFLQLLLNRYNHFIVYCIFARIFLTSAHEISEADELDQYEQADKEQQLFEEEVLRGMQSFLQHEQQELVQEMEVEIARMTERRERLDFNWWPFDDIGGGGDAASSVVDAPSSVAWEPWQVEFQNLEEYAHHDGNGDLSKEEMREFFFGVDEGHHHDRDWYADQVQHMPDAEYELWQRMGGDDTGNVDDVWSSLDEDWGDHQEDHTVHMTDVQDAIKHNVDSSNDLKQDLNEFRENAGFARWGGTDPLLENEPDATNGHGVNVRSFAIFFDDAKHLDLFKALGGEVAPGEDKPTQHEMEDLFNKLNTDHPGLELTTSGGMDPVSLTLVEQSWAEPPGVHTQALLSMNEILAGLNQHGDHLGLVTGQDTDRHTDMNIHEFFDVHGGTESVRTRPEYAPTLVLDDNHQQTSGDPLHVPDPIAVDHDQDHESAPAPDGAAAASQHEDDHSSSQHGGRSHVHEHGHDAATTHHHHHDQHDAGHQSHHRSHHHHHHPHPSSRHGATPAPSPAREERGGQTTSTPDETTSASSASPAPASPASLATSLTSKMAPVADTVKQHAGEAAVVAGSVAAVGGAALGARRALKAARREQNKNGTTKSEKSSGKTQDLHGDVKKSQGSNTKTSAPLMKEKVTEELPSASSNLQVTQDDEEHAKDGQTVSNDNYEDELSADKGGKDRTRGDEAAEREQQRPVDDLHADSRSSVSKTSTSPEKPEMSSRLKSPSDAETTPTSASSSASSPASTPRSSSATPRRGNLRGTAAFLQKLEKMEK